MINALSIKLCHITGLKLIVSIEKTLQLSLILHAGNAAVHPVGIRVIYLVHSTIFSPLFQEITDISSEFFSNLTNNESGSQIMGAI